MAKYPRTFHLEYSPGGTNDDKRIKSSSGFISSKSKKIEIAITEKLDGSNACIKSDGVFARSHNKVAHHPSFDLLKSTYNQIKSLLKENQQIFGENCFAVHSISYNALPSYFFVFGIRENDSRWLSLDEVISRSNDLGLKTAPILFRGHVSSEKELQDLVEKLCKEPSIFGGEREGAVVRITDSFLDESFSTSVAKWVRKDHVQTDEHWMFQKVVKQKLKDSK